MSWVAVAVGGASLVGGIIQSSAGRRREKNAEQAIENSKSPAYYADNSILDYYNKALQRYSSNPYTSAQYMYGVQQGKSATASAVSALQDRRSAVGSIGKIIGLENNNALRQGVAAENEQAQILGQLGNAAGAKTSEDRNQFNNNLLLPYQQKLQILGLKASGGAAERSAGWQNIFNGIGSAGMAYAGSDGTGNMQNIFGSKKETGWA